MRLLPSDPDIQTVLGRIRIGDLNLQPDFQRGEVWGTPKKQRLIDSILRDWHIPPLHVIQVPESNVTEVLDGQQRLVAIRDFADDTFVIDGSIQPHDDDIAALHGMRYSELPPEWRRRFAQFTLRVFRITDYSPEEPGELFYRLNQNVNLTTAEQRNAFFGPARQQIKELVDQLVDAGAAKQFIGFSNSRMAYDDVVARLCQAIEVGGVDQKITAGILADRYRAAVPFREDVMANATRSIERFREAREASSHPVKLNKATFFSWLWFFHEERHRVSQQSGTAVVSEFLPHFEALRQSSRHADVIHQAYAGELIRSGRDVELLMSIYDDRASSRVADVASVLYRNAILWLFYLDFCLQKPADRFRRPIQHLAETVHQLWPPLEAGSEDFVQSLIHNLELGLSPWSGPGYVR